MAQRIFDRRQSFFDAGIVHDATVFKGDVEIHAHENATVVDGKIANGKLGHAGCPREYCGRAGDALPTSGRWPAIF